MKVRTNITKCTVQLSGLQTESQTLFMSEEGRRHREGSRGHIQTLALLGLLPFGSLLISEFCLAPGHFHTCPIAECQD